ncbi:MAG: AAA family ATPase [Dehalococcoidales bacterium]|jgi:hypothetical protein
MSGGWKEEAEGLEKKKKPSISKTDIMNKFKPATEITSVSSLKLALYGLPKTGKTHLAITARKPVYIIDTEKSSNLLLQMLSEEDRKDIHVLDVMEYTDKRDGKSNLNLTMSLELIEDAIEALHDIALVSPVKGTIVLDSASDLWDFLKSWLNEDVDDKKVTKDGRMMQVEWSKPNARYTETMRLLIKAGWNVILTFRAEEVFGSKGERLGVYKPKGQKDTLFWVDQIVEMQQIGNNHILRFHGGRFGDLQGSELTNPAWKDLIDFLSLKSGVKFAEN